jgi:hypothetical protein
MPKSIGRAISEYRNNTVDVGSLVVRWSVVLPTVLYCEIWDSYNGDYEEYGLLQCDAM